MTSLIGYSNTQYDAILALETRVSDLNTAITTNKTYADTQFGLINTKNNTQDTRIAGVTGAFVTLTTDQATSSSVISGLETARANLQGTASTYETIQGEIQNAFSGYDTLVGDIETRVNTTIFNALALKGDTGTFNDLASAVTNIGSDVSAAIALRVEKQAQLSIDNAQDALQANYDSRVLAIKEFIQVLQKTYVINKPDGNPYTFSIDSIQNNNVQVPSLKILNVLNKKSINDADWGLTLKLSDYGYNQLLGKVSVTYTSGTPGVSKKFAVSKADIDATTKEVQLNLLGVRDGTSVANNLLFPFNVTYEDVKGQALFSQAITAQYFADLTSAV